MSRTASAILPSSKVAELVGIKPKGEQFERGSFGFPAPVKFGVSQLGRLKKLC